MLVLPGDRVSLRDWRADEADAMHRWRGDPTLLRFLGWGSRTPEESAAHLRECLADQQSTNRERYFFAVELRESAAVIGSVGVHWRSRKYGGGELGLGYFLEPAFWGRGLAAEACGTLVEFCFEQLAAHKISASCDAGNHASERVMQKLGMTREAEIRESHMRFGEWRNRLWYGILRSEWPASPSDGRAA